MLAKKTRDLRLNFWYRKWFFWIYMCQNKVSFLI
jgi:hypothetical protein